MCLTVDLPCHSAAELKVHVFAKVKSSVLLYGGAFALKKGQ